MFKVLEKDLLAENIYRMVVEAPLVAEKAKAGNFVIVRVSDVGERIPLTICDNDPERGTLTLIIQAVGKSTRDLVNIPVGDYVKDVLGPLGTATEIKDMGRIIAVMGGIGVAPMLPLLRAYRKKGAEIISILGARTKDLLILQDEVRSLSDEVILVTDDGSEGMKGLVTDPLRQRLESGEHFDMAIAIGPARMMQAASKVTKEFNLPTLVSLNSIMIDGTGMCGGCRVSINGETKFACVDGPDFDGHAVNFDELVVRQGYYRDEEDHVCRTLGEERV
ncbi:MAG TPA: sulfide/dihydroorotate dehydrogenase-like FAD/NAD-binding protein [Limnochordia bacterium]|nr:sulfide/dihydroorotate dehydrogenase-like FAD/NAD-binding protein [Limnochordia bacterium]